MPLQLQKLLNPQQLEAAEADDGPLLVLAAAGTGKTRTLVYRVAHIVDTGIRPEQILLLTFTNRAAGEMVERAHDVVGENVGNVWSGTFHHVCNRILRRFGHLLGYSPDFSILDRDDSRGLIQQCLKDLKLNHKHFPKRDVLLGWISSAANRQCDVVDILYNLPPDTDIDVAAVRRVADAYEVAKKRLGGMDFDDLLTNCLYLIESESEVREKYQEQFHHILVDEYQDTNIIQAKLVDLLAARRRNLMVVGDDFQCIYAWRGANYRNILDFPQRYPEAAMVKLELNYRSRPEILAVANAAIAGNHGQFRKTLRATRASNSAAPKVFMVRDGAHQANLVRRRIEKHIEQGRRPDQIAVLYRAHFHSIELQMKLAQAQVPFKVTSGVGVFEQAHVKDLLAFLRVAVSATDELAFRRLLMLLPGVGPRSAEKIWGHLGGCFRTDDPKARDLLASKLAAAAREVWKPLDRLLAEYHDRNTKADDIIAGFINNFYQPLAFNTYDDAERRLEDLREVALEIGRAKSIPLFLQEVALLTNVDLEYKGKRQPQADKQVRLSTVHQAKGLEWPVVIILWAVEGMFPSSRALEESDDDTEERRLFYVAVTRAADNLELFVPRQRAMRDGGCFPCAPSRFVEEIPHHLLQTRYETGSDFTEPRRQSSYFRR